MDQNNTQQATNPQQSVSAQALVPPDIHKYGDSQNRNFLKRLFALDIFMHFITLILLTLIAFVVWMSFVRESPMKPQSRQQADAEAVNNMQRIMNIKPPEIRRVYANTAFVDPEKVFSTSVSNISLAIRGVPGKVVYAFFPYWMLAAQEKINISALTTVSLFGLEIDGQGNIITVYPDGNADGGWQMWNDPRLDQFIARARARKIKLELTIKAFSNTNIERLVSSDLAQERAIENILHLVNLKSLDGVTLDFEYVGNPSNKVRDGFTRFVINLNTALNQQLPFATLTICTYVSAGVVPGIFDLPALAPYVDSFVIMGYDFHTPQGLPGPVAPMEGEVSILSYVNAYLDKVPPEKIILAIPYYGYDWHVGGSAGQRSKILTYVELAQASKNITLQWDEVAQTPWYRYADPETNATREVHFENTRSLGVKYDYINRKNLKGVGIWALGFDGVSADLRQLIIEKFSK